MTDAWDAEDFEPEPATTASPKPIVVAVTDKWEGEDEDEDNIKDSWDKDEEEESESTAEKTEKQREREKAYQKKKKKKLADIIAEKEAAKLAELEKKRAEEEAKRKAETPEAIAAEKLRLLKLEEQVNLQMAKELLGVSSGSIDSMTPVTKEEFEKFSSALVEKISSFSTSEHYNDFVENFIKSLCLDLNASVLKKIKMNIEALHTTKLKEEKAAKSKKNKKGGVVKMDLAKDLYDDGGYDDIDDFM